MFFIKVQGLGGRVEEITRLRNLYINGSQTKDNKKEYALGKKLLNNKQKELLKKQSVQSNLKHIKLQQKTEDEFSKYLESKGVK